MLSRADLASEEHEPVFVGQLEAGSLAVAGDSHVDNRADSVAVVGDLLGVEVTGKFIDFPCHRQPDRQQSRTAIP